MHFDDFLAAQMLKTNDPSPAHDVDAQRRNRRALRTAGRHLRQVARRINAFSGRRRHGKDVPGDPEPHNRPRRLLHR